MAKNSVRDYSATASLNTDVQSVDIDEQCAPSGINNAIREVMADIKNVSTGAIALESPAADSLSVTGNITVSGTVDGRDVAADGTKLDGIEAGATANQTAAEIKTSYESNANTNEFSDAEQTKLAGIETGATADQTGAEIATAISGETVGSITLTSADINGGTIDGAVIGGTTPAAGTFTTLTATGDLTVDTNTLYVDSTNNRVGIGTSSPATALDVSGEITATNRYLANTGGGATKGYQFTGDGNTGMYSDTSDTLQFSTAGSERLRIDSSGNVYQNVGGTSERGYRVEAGSDDWTYIWGRNSADTSPVFYAQVGNVARAEIESDGSFHSSANSYGGFSDQNYKENITLSGSQWDDIKAIQVKKYSWIHDNLDAPNQIGVVAQDLEASGMSGLVTNHTKIVLQDDGTETAALDDDGNPITYKSVKYSIIYMKAIKALQEAMAKIETLETENTTQATQIADLITRVTALEGN